MLPRAKVPLECGIDHIWREPVFAQPVGCTEGGRLLIDSATLAQWAERLSPATLENLLQRGAAPACLVSQREGINDEREVLCESRVPQQNQGRVQMQR